MCKSSLISPPFGEHLVGTCFPNTEDEHVEPENTLPNGKGENHQHHQPKPPIFGFKMLVFEMLVFEG